MEERVEERAILMTRDNMVHVACETHYTLDELKEMMETYGKRGRAIMVPRPIVKASALGVRPVL